MTEIYGNMTLADERMHPTDDHPQFNESALLTDAAATFALQQGNALASNVVKGIGLTEARVQAGGSLQQTALYLGTQLTPRLFVGYGLGLFETLNVFRLRYLLNSSWTIEAESAKESRANVLFTRER